MSKLDMLNVGADVYRFVTALELAVRFGKTLIVEDADSLPPLMQPLISGDLQGHGSSTMVRIGDRTIDYNKDFRLILSTRNSSPQLLLDAEAYLSVANFTVTRYAEAIPLFHNVLTIVWCKVHC